MQATTVKPAIPQPFVRKPRKPNYALYIGGAAFVGLLVIIGAIALLFSLNNSSRETAQTTNTQNVNASRNANITTNQNTNPSNANSTTANSNAQTNSNVDPTNANLANANVNANANVAPTPDKAQLQQVANRYVAGALKVDGMNEGLKSARRTVYGDVDGDGDDDAVVQFVAVPGEGNWYGIEIALFINNDGKFEGVADAIVGGKNYRGFDLASVKNKKIVGRIYLCNEEFPRDCLEGETPYTKGQAVINWTGKKLIVPENDSLKK